MECTRYRDQLERHVDGELDSALERSLLTHVETCPACTAALQEMKDLHRRLSGMAVPPGPHGLPDDLMRLVAKVEAERSRASDRPLPRRLVDPVASLVASIPWPGRHCAGCGQRPGTLPAACSLCREHEIRSQHAALSPATCALAGATAFFASLAAFLVVTVMQRGPVAADAPFAGSEAAVSSRADARPDATGGQAFDDAMRSMATGETAADSHRDRSGRWSRSSRRRVSHRHGGRSSWRGGRSQARELLATGPIDLGPLPDDLKVEPERPGPLAPPAADVRSEPWQEHGDEARQGSAEALVDLARAYARGSGVAADSKTAFELYLRAALAGDRSAMAVVAVYYSRGNGVAQDQKRAVRWFWEAGTRGHVNAVNCVGLAYQKGQGVAKDPARALRCFLAAANAGLAAASFSVGLCYQQGVGTAADPARAALWFLKARQQGDGVAHGKLLEMGARDDPAGRGPTGSTQEPARR